MPVREFEAPEATAWQAKAPAARAEITAVWRCNVLSWRVMDLKMTFLLGRAQEAHIVS